MPYKSVSDAEKTQSGLKKYTPKAKRGWLSSFNKCMDDGGPESKCYAIAYSVANKVDGKSAGLELTPGQAEIIERGWGMRWDGADGFDDVSAKGGLVRGRTYEDEMDQVPSGLTAARNKMEREATSSGRMIMTDRDLAEELVRLAEDIAEPRSRRAALISKLEDTIMGLRSVAMAKAIRDRAGEWTMVVWGRGAGDETSYEWAEDPKRIWSKAEKMAEKMGFSLEPSSGRRFSMPKKSGNGRYNRDRLIFQVEEVNPEESGWGGLGGLFASERTADMPLRQEIKALKLKGLVDEYADDLKKFRGSTNRFIEALTGEVDVSSLALFPELRGVMEVNLLLRKKALPLAHLDDRKLKERLELVVCKDSGEC